MTSRRDRRDGVCATTSRRRRLKDPATVATIDQPDELGANALTLAASLNVPKPEIIKALLKAGADVNAKLGEEWSEKDTSALYRAVEGESLCGNQPVCRVHKPFLGDDATVLAASRRERPTPPRRRAGVASMA